MRIHILFVEYLENRRYPYLRRFNIYNQTTLNSLGIIFIIVLGLFLFILPRQKAIIPILIMACFIAPGQRLVVAGLDFNLIRLMVLFGWIRIILKKEIIFIKLNKLDIVIILWAIILTIVYSIQNRSFSALINRLGVMFDAVGMYFLFRSILRSKKDIDKLIIAFIYLSFPVLFFFILERLTGHNIFSVFGGVPEITLIREGRLRVQGAFAHPILAGCFWAVLLPLFYYELYNINTNKKLVIVGIVSTLIIVFLSASSTPIISILVGIIGGFFIRYRDKMKEIRLLLLLGIILLDFITESPFYHILARVDISGGSTGWHRYNLIHQAMLHWKDWLVLGVSSIDNWGVWANDVTNQYVLEAIRGGALTLILFIIIIIVSFNYIGMLWREYDNQKEMIIFFWSIGVSLFMHVTNFIAVSYFGQIWIMWYMILAFVSALFQEYVH